MKPTKEQMRKYGDFVRAHALERRKNFGEKFNSIDFAMGAACAYYFFEVADQMPASWVFGPLSGEDPFK